jgi:hypothetical protein
MNSPPEDLDIVHARATQLNIFLRVTDGPRKRREYVARSAAITFDGTTWEDMPESVEGVGKTIAEAQTNFWSRWLVHCIKNRLGNVYLTTETEHALDA